MHKLFYLREDYSARAIQFSDNKYNKYILIDNQGNIIHTHSHTTLKECLLISNSFKYYNLKFKTKYYKNFMVNI